MENPETSLKEKTIILLVSILLGFIFERFFVDKNFAISYTLFTFMFLGFLGYYLKDKLNLKKAVYWFTLISILLLAFTFTIHLNPVLRFINILIIPLLVTAHILLITYEQVEWDKFIFLKSLFKRMFKLTFENMPKPFIFMKKSIKFKDKKQDNTIKKDIIKGLIISIPILFIVILLLTSADMVFNYYLTNISRVFDNINIGNFIWHLLIIIFVSLYIFGYLWSFKYPYNNINLQSKNSKHFNIVTLLTVITAVNLVYLLFSIIQFSYLYGGTKNMFPQGFTYAEYARKGFFELVFVALINFAIILYSLNFSKDSSSKLSLILNFSLSLLIVFTFNMLFSAHYKLSLYEDTYGFTYLRVFVHIFMLLLFILFIITLLGIWNKKINIVKLCVITTVIMYIFLNYINVDVLIAKKNIERYQNTGKIDVNYLTHLSYDALPEIIKLKDDKNTEVSSKILTYICDNQEHFNSKKYSWTEFNYSEYKAKKYLLTK